MDHDFERCANCSHLTHGLCDMCQRGRCIGCMQSARVYTYFESYLAALAGPDFYDTLNGVACYACMHEYAEGP